MTFKGFCSLTGLLCLFFCIFNSGVANAQTTHILNPSPTTVHWGHYRADLKPVLTINSGDIVIIDTVTSTAPEDFEEGGIPPGSIPQALRDIYKEYNPKERGPGSHILTGPIYINGAEPGDMLEIQIKDIKLTAPFGFNRNNVGWGTLPEDFPYYAIRILKMDLDKMTTELYPGVVVPLKPFFGHLGVAPTYGQGKIGSGPPGIHGGNLDNKELLPGTIVYLPIHIKGALFSAGDCHGVQGDGEVNLSALETFGKGTFQLFVRKNKRIKWPRAETPTHYMSMGLHEDLNIAAKMAVKEMIDFLYQEKGIDPEYGYMIVSLAGDLRVTQTVDGVKGIHVMMPKEIFVKK